LGSDPQVNNSPDSVIFFDGVCNLCNGAVQFVIRRDKEGRFKFSSLQSDYAKESLGDFGIDASMLESILLLENGKLHKKSEAVLRINRRLPFPWPMLSIFWIIPRGLRDVIYEWVANNRYRWFGRKDVCMVPTPELQTRFL
jgi:predicted DCC family thiol-disulfide oxidoreductase YuxK